MSTFINYVVDMEGKNIKTYSKTICYIIFLRIMLGINLILLDILLSSILFLLLSVFCLIKNYNDSNQYFFNQMDKVRKDKQESLLRQQIEEKNNNIILNTISKRDSMTQSFREKYNLCFEYIFSSDAVETEYVIGYATDKEKRFKTLLEFMRFVYEIRQWGCQFQIWLTIISGIKTRQCIGINNGLVNLA